MSRDVQDIAIEKGMIDFFAHPSIWRNLSDLSIVHRIIQKIGYPTKNPDLLDASAVRKYYEGVRVSNDSYFANTLGIAEFKSRQEWAKLGKPTNRDEWLMTAVTVNVGGLHS